MATAFDPDLKKINAIACSGFNQLTKTKDSWFNDRFGPSPRLAAILPFYHIVHIAVISMITFVELMRLPSLPELGYHWTFWNWTILNP